MGSSIADALKDDKAAAIASVRRNGVFIMFNSINCFARIKPPRVQPQAGEDWIMVVEAQLIAHPKKWFAAAARCLCRQPARSAGGD